MRIINQTDPNTIQNGDVMAIVHYVKVHNIDHYSQLFDGEDLDQSGNFIRVKGKDLLERAFSADRYSKEEKITKTQAAELLVHSVNRPFTVCFEKSDGSERTLRGRLVKPEPLLGRSMVEDLDEKEANKVRMVDHRTIKSLIVEGTKYVVK